MAFAKPTLTALINRIESDLLAQVGSESGFLRRSLLRIEARVWGAAIYLTYTFLGNLALQMFVNTAAGEYLEYHAERHGKTRKQATYSVGLIRLSGTAYTVVPIGTKWASAEGVQYAAIIQGIIMPGGIGITQVKSTATGADTNLAADEILTLVSPIVGLYSQAEVMAPGIQGGDDIETDDGLRDRLFLKIQNPAMGGSDADYKQWAMDTPSLGVTRVWVIREFMGPGTVGVFFVLDNQTPIFPNSTNIGLVQAQIDAHKPLTARPTVYSPVERKIGLTIRLSPNTADVQASVIENLEAFSKSDIDVGEAVYLSQLDEQVSLATGEVDHEITGMRVDGNAVSVGNLQLGANELGTISGDSISFTS